MKKIVIAIALTMVLSTAGFVFAEDKYSVSGEVIYSGESNIYVCLHTMKTFASFRKELPPPGFMQIVKADVAGKAPFSIEDVPKGEYLIHIFVDENNNGKFDCDTWGYPIEPACMYKPPLIKMHTNWYDQKFEVDSDVTGLVLKLHD